MLPQATQLHTETDPLTHKRIGVSALAQYITDTSNRNVRHVELCGPLARGELCSEVYIIICTDGLTASRWLDGINFTLRYAPRSLELAPANVRRLQSLQYTGVDLGDLPECIVGIDSHQIDCLLLPDNWRQLPTGLLLFEEHLPSSVYPHTMQALAQEALTFIPGQGFAWPLLPRI